jgi:cardiolipin synthase
MDQSNQPPSGSPQKLTPAHTWLTAPNLLSLSRVPLGVAFWFVIDSTPTHIIWPYTILTAAGVTDVLDGYLARRQGVTRVSDDGLGPAVLDRGGSKGPSQGPFINKGVGSWLDPICDKLFVALVLVSIALHRPVPLLLMALIGGRELIQLPVSLTYRFIPMLRHWLRYDFTASPLGKAGTVTQFLAMAALLIDHPAVWIMAGIAFVVGMAALVDYLRRAVILARQRRITSPPT